MFHRDSTVEFMLRLTSKAEMFKNDVFFRLKSLCISGPNVPVR